MFCSTMPVSVIYFTLLAICSAVVVFPHHFAPSISTAPLPANLRSKSPSAILFLYVFTILCIYFQGAKVQHLFHNSAIWPIFVRPFGRFSFTHLADFRPPVWLGNEIREICGRFIHTLHLLNRQAGPLHLLVAKQVTLHLLYFLLQPRRIVFLRIPLHFVCLHIALKRLRT